MRYQSKTICRFSFRQLFDNLFSSFAIQYYRFVLVSSLMSSPSFLTTGLHHSNLHPLKLILPCFSVLTILFPCKRVQTERITSIMLDLFTLFFCLLLSQYFFKPFYDISYKYIALNFTKFIPKFTVERVTFIHFHASTLRLQIS